MNDIESICVLDKLGLCICLIVKTSPGFYDLHLILPSESLFASSFQVLESCTIVYVEPRIFAGHHEYITVRISGAFRQPVCVFGAHSSSTSVSLLDEQSVRCPVASGLNGNVTFSIMCFTGVPSRNNVMLSFKPEF